MHGRAVTYWFFLVQFDGRFPGPCLQVSTYKSAFNVGATQSSYKSFSNSPDLAKTSNGTLLRVRIVSWFQYGGLLTVS